MDQQHVWRNARLPDFSHYSGNLMRKVNKAMNFSTTSCQLHFYCYAWFLHPAAGFRIKSLAEFGWCARLGYQTYFFIIIGAGHNSKFRQLAMLHPLIAGLVMACKGRFWGGMAIFGFFFGLNLASGHPQITYYSAFIMLALLVAFFINAQKTKTLKTIYKAIGFLAIAGILAVGSNFSNLWFTYDYGKDSIRGKSELTDNQHNKTSGLDKDYVTQWSYGVAETFNMLIPNLMGGASSMDVGVNSETFKFLRQNGVPFSQAQTIVKQLPTYWGPQPSTSGPVLRGRHHFFPLILGMFLLRGPEKWALFAVTLLESY